MKDKINPEALSVLPERIYSYMEMYSPITKELFYKTEGIEFGYAKTPRNLGFFIDLKSLERLSLSSLNDLKESMFSNFSTYQQSFNQMQQVFLEAVGVFKSFDAKAFLATREQLYHEQILTSKKQLASMKSRALAQLTDEEKKQDKAEVNQRIVRELDNLGLREDWNNHLKILSDNKSSIKRVGKEVEEQRILLWQKISSVLAPYMTELKVDRAGRYLETYLMSFLEFKRPMSHQEFSPKVERFIHLAEVMSQTAEGRELLTLLLNKFSNLKFSTSSLGYQETETQALIKKFVLSKEIPPLCHTRLSSFNKTILPDCGESTVRNLINLFIWNPENHRLDLSLLQSCFPHMHPAVIAFYSSYSSFDSILSQEAHNQWFEVCSGHEGVEYLYPAYAPMAELAPGYLNFEKLFQSLFGVKDLAEFMEAMILASGKEIAIHKHEESQEMKISFSFKEHVVDIIFIKRHFRTFEAGMSSQKNWEEKFDHLSRLFAREVSSYGKFVSGCLLTEGHDFNDVLNDLLTVFPCVEQSFAVLLSSKLDLIEAREDFCLKMLAHPRFSTQAFVWEAISCIAASMPDNEDHGFRKQNVLAALSKAKGMNKENLLYA